MAEYKVTVEEFKEKDSSLKTILAIVGVLFILFIIGSFVNSLSGKSSVVETQNQQNPLSSATTTSFISQTITSQSQPINPSDVKCNNDYDCWKNLGYKYYCKIETGSGKCELGCSTDWACLRLYGIGYNCNSQTHQCEKS